MAGRRPMGIVAKAGAPAAPAAPAHPESRSTLSVDPCSWRPLRARLTGCAGGRTKRSRPRRFSARGGCPSLVIHTRKPGLPRSSRLLHQQRPAPVCPVPRGRDPRQS